MDAAARAVPTSQVVDMYASTNTVPFPSVIASNPVFFTVIVQPDAVFVPCFTCAVTEPSRAEAPSTET